MIIHVTFVPNAFYKYRPKSDWCKHGILITDKEGRASDTYWTAGRCVDYERAWPWDYIEANFEDVQFIGRVEDFEALVPHKWDWYEQKDLLFIPDGGTNKRRLVRIGAKPNPMYVLAWYDSQIADAQSSIAWKKREIERLEQERTGWVSRAGEGMKP